MIKKMRFVLLTLSLVAQTALCDWHHHSHGSGGAPDPGFESSLWTCVIILVASFAILILAGPILVLRARRIRDILWSVPLLNTVFYLLSIGLRPYPGGFRARCQPAGFANTVLEVGLLLASSLIIVLILLLVRWILRARRERAKARESEAMREATACRNARG